MINYRGCILTNLSGIFAILMISACSSNNGKSGNSNYNRLLSSDSIPKVIKNIVRAVNENNSSMFAGEINYPLLRPYPLKDIQNQDEMKSYYRVLVDDSLRNRIINSAPEDWQRYGWRGYSLGDGSYLWIDDYIYAINYVSKKERQLIDSLTVVEKNSLPALLIRGWEPILTYESEDKTKIYRIDKQLPSETTKIPAYRLSIYNISEKKNNLLNMPAILMEGYLRTEGTATIVSYVFNDDKNHNQYIVYPEDPGSGTPTITMPDGDEEPLTKAYWYELVR